MRFGDSIDTPNGKGYFAGWIMLVEDGPVYVLVRHNAALLPEKPAGLCITPEAQFTTLLAYANEQIK